MRSFKILFSFLKVLVALCFLGGGVVNAMEKTSVFMKRSEINDQKMSGTGYSFNVQDGKPQEFSFEVDGTGDEALKIMRDLGYDPFPDVASIAPAPEVKDTLKFPKVPTVAVPYLDKAPTLLQKPEFKPLTFFADNTPSKSDSKVQKVSAVYPQSNELGTGGVIPKYPYAPGFDDAKSNFVKTEGKSYSDYVSAKNGAKTDTSYNIIDAYDQALKGKFNNDYGKAVYGLGGGTQVAAFDKVANVNAQGSGGLVALGGGFGQADYHDKGDKTTGYHKVYRKDDYDKQHKFYDKADRNGKFNKYGDLKVTDDKVAGTANQGAQHTAGIVKNQYGVTEASDTATFDDYVKGFRNGIGNEGFYQNWAGWNGNAAQNSGKTAAASINV